MLIFGLQQLLPGDPAIVLAGEERDPNVVAYLREKLHLDEPLPVRYAYWLGGVLHGDLGESLRIQKPVTRADRREAAGHARARGDRDRHRARDRHSGGHRLRRASRARAWDYAANVSRAVGTVDAQFLARASC